MSISLTEDNIFKGITLHSFNENLEDSNPSEHSVNDDVVTIYILMKDTENDGFGIRTPLLRDAIINFKELNNIYPYLQNQWIESPERFEGWIYADELDINKLIRKG